MTPGPDLWAPTPLCIPTPPTPRPVCLPHNTISRKQASKLKDFNRLGRGCSYHGSGKSESRSMKVRHKQLCPRRGDGLTRTIGLLTHIDCVGLPGKPQVKTLVPSLFGPQPTPTGLQLARAGDSMSYRCIIALDLSGLPCGLPCTFPRCS